MNSRIVRPAASFQSPETCTEHEECQAAQTPHSELCDKALAHYEEVSAAAHHWNSLVPRAVEFYKLHGSRASIAAPPNHAMVQLLEAALLHPESAEGNIRQVIKLLSVAAVEGDAIHWQLSAGVAETMCGVSVKSEEGIHVTLLSDKATCKACQAAEWGYKCGRATASSSIAAEPPPICVCAITPNERCPIHASLCVAPAEPLQQEGERERPITRHLGTPSSEIPVAGDDEGEK